MKDIFIDNNVAKNFANPVDPEYKRLIRWLRKFDGDLEDSAHLVVSNKLIAEYKRTSGGAYSGTNIAVIIGQLNKEGRLPKITNQQIKDFQRKYFKKKVIRRLTCNREDQDHIPVVLLSHRKYALSLDNDFTRDLMNFPGFNAWVEKRPQDLPYDQ